ncbi:MAG: Unknown protein [uncultured Sulfurovum sp.]|uniref:WGR domain-containing protein n=1 Tax=uncultured Sulfurovum sp. TaxID=269237 RepID=A0A6S6SRX9_9BACT|nr:MAG: Unknown protein [uncultured Sulfurovum sp.]
MKTIKKTLLHYQKGTSNKVYNVYLIQVNGSEYLVNFEYGRYGSTLREGTKTSSPVGLERAEKLFDSLVVSKMNKEYVVKEGYDSTKKEEKSLRKVLSSEAYQQLLIARLKKVGEVERIEHSRTQANKGATGFRALHSARETVVTVTNHLKKVDNYQVSRLIYKAGQLKIEEAKELIVNIYKMQTDEENAFYYSVAWALGRYKDPSLQPIIESIREKLDDTSRYVVEEALLLSKTPSQLLQEKAEMHKLLICPIPFKLFLQNKDLKSIIQELAVLEERTNSAYDTYHNIDYWYKEGKREAKQALMPFIEQVDEIYLKLYILASFNLFEHEVFVEAVRHLPINQFNFSLFRRLYKMAEIRDDYAVLAVLITKLESKKATCYTTYDDNWNPKPSVGCSLLYFKKRSLRYLEHLSLHDEQGYILFAKSILLSVNPYGTEFEAFTTEYYDSTDWKWKHKQYDAYCRHLTFMKILFGNGQRYMLDPSKKMWEIANKNINDEVRPELHKELWDKNALVAFNILVESRIDLVQKFAFNVLKDNPNKVEGVLLNLPPVYFESLMQLRHSEARTFFFSLFKEQYIKTGNEQLLKAFLFSVDEEINLFAVQEIHKNLDFLSKENIVVEIIEKCNESIMKELLGLLTQVENKRVIIEQIVTKIVQSSFPLKKLEAVGLLFVLRYLGNYITNEDISRLMEGDVLTERHLFTGRIMRFETLAHLEYPLELKEKIAKFDHPEMLATTIYLLGKLEENELMAAHEMLVSFLFHEEKAVHKEARSIMENLASNKENGMVLLRSIVEKSFVATPDEVAKNVTMTIKSMKKSYEAIEPDQLYRMLIAKSKLAVALGSLILKAYKAKDFSVVQWSRMAKNPNKTVRVWAYDAYMNNIESVKEAMPKSLMIFDSVWEDTRVFASGYFESFEMSTNDIVVVADSNYEEVQAFAKKMIMQGNYDTEVLLTKLSQHPSLTIQKFVTDLMLAEMSDEQLLKMERFFNSLLHSVNQNRVAKTRVMMLLKTRLENLEIAQMVGRLASHHSATMVWSDKELYVEMMTYLAQNHSDIDLPLNVLEAEKREVV